MAKQVGPLFITGTIDGIIFYKLNGQYYMRAKGSYKSGKNMRKDPRLKRTMANADRFGGASKLVQEVYYRHLPREVRKHGLFGKLTGMVNRWLYQGKSTEETEALLIAYCQTLQAQSTNEAASAPIALSPEKTSSLPGNRKDLAATPTPALRPTSTRIFKPKKARYLSRWKVKPNGRLHISRPVTTVGQPHPDLLE